MALYRQASASEGSEEEREPSALSDDGHGPLQGRERGKGVTDSLQCPSSRLISCDKHL